jgi:hypothetical protein
MVLDYDSPVGFVIVCHSGKSFVALAESARAKQEWLDAFSECFAALKGSEVRSYSCILPTTAPIVTAAVHM